VTGRWGSLSVVSSPFPTGLTTADSVPLLDDLGRPVPSREVEGAVTVELTAAQAQLAGQSSRLWVQGGTPADPVLDAPQLFPDTYTFGALRCAIDNLNGDNVEWIKFPQGSRHVFCFAYYVVPPPDSGTIVIRKELEQAPESDQAFTFEGNVSYTVDRRFNVTVRPGSTAGSATFYRAETGPADEPWTVREVVAPGWTLTDLSCTAGGSSVTIDGPGAVSIRLAAGDVVTCTFRNALRPQPGSLLISKITTGGLGTFGFTIRPRDGGDAIRASATTTDEGVPAAAEPGPIELDPGTYEVSERSPRSRRGRWRRTAVTCNGERRSGTVRVTVTSGQGVACTFENRFIPRGSIAIDKVTRGGVGTTGFVISPLSGRPREFLQTATTTRPGRPARARGDSTRRLRLGRYVIQETGTVSEREGSWTLLWIRCGDRLRPFTQGRVTVRLTPERPQLVCRFVNRFSATLPSVPPGPPTTPETEPDLVVGKRALRSSVPLGGIVRFEITVRNRGTGAAEQVVVADDAGARASVISFRASQGTCSLPEPLTCRLGRLDPGERATIRVRMQATAMPTIVNAGVAGSASEERTLGNNDVRARVSVRPPVVVPKGLG
jgi:hypothetical protein